MADWLVGLGIATIAMESTGVYWIRVLEVLLVNARDVKNVPGRVPWTRAWYSTLSQAS